MGKNQISGYTSRRMLKATAAKALRQFADSFVDDTKSITREEAEAAGVDLSDVSEDHDVGGIQFQAPEAAITYIERAFGRLQRSGIREREEAAEFLRREARKLDP